MELRLFSCLSFLWPDKDASNCDACAHCSGAAPRQLDSSSWENQLTPLLHRINDPAELRRILGHCLGDGGIAGQISLSRLLLPFKLHSWDVAGSGGEREEEEGEEDDVDERLVMAIDDVVAAVAEADSQGCVRSLVSAFEFFDRDGDGVISAADLLPALRDVLVAGGEEDGQQGERGAPSPAACEEMVAAFDRERVGGVCFADFIRMMTGPDGDQYCRRPSCRRPVPDSVLKPAHP